MLVICQKYATECLGFVFFKWRQQGFFLLKWENNISHVRLINC